MTTLTVNVQNESILPSLKKILNAIPGIKVIQHREKKPATKHITENISKKS